MNPVSSKTSIHKAAPQRGNKEVSVVIDMKYPTKIALPLQSAEEESSALARTTLVVELVYTPVAPIEPSTNTFSMTWTEAGVTVSYFPTRTAPAVLPLTQLGATHSSSYWEMTRQWNFGGAITIRALATSTTAGTLDRPAMTRFSKMLTCARSISLHIKAPVRSFKEANSPHQLTRLRPDGIPSLTSATNLRSLDQL